MGERVLLARDHEGGDREGQEAPLISWVYGLKGAAYCQGLMGVAGRVDWKTTMINTPQTPANASTSTGYALLESRASGPEESESWSPTGTAKTPLVYETVNR